METFYIVSVIVIVVVVAIYGFYYDLHRQERQSQQQVRQTQRQVRQSQRHARQSYMQTPAKRWSEKVLTRHRAIALALDLLREEDVKARSRVQSLLRWDADAQRKEFFRAYLSQHKLEQLNSVPGIGSSTITILNEAGLRTFADIGKYDFESLPGIGPAKAKLLTSATKQFIKELDTQFEKGICPEALAYDKAAKEAQIYDAPILQRAAVEQADRDRRIAALSNALLEDDERYARAMAISLQFTFSAYVSDPGAFLIDAEQDVDLPSVEDILAAVSASQSDASATATVAKQPMSPQALVVFGDLLTPARPTVPVVAATQSAPTVAPTRNRSADNLFVTADPLAPQSAPTASQPIPAPDVPPLLAELKAFAALGMLIARADGKIAASERAEVRRFLASQYEHDSRLVRQIDPAIEQAEKARAASDLVFMALLKVCTDPAKRTLAYNFAVRVSDASSGRSAKELALLKRLEETFKLAAPKAEVPVVDVPTPANRKPDPVPSAVAPALLETPTPAKPAIPTQVPAKPDEPLNIRDNALLDDVFQDQPAPSPVPPVPPPVSGSADLRQNDLLDDVFGG